MMDNTGSARKKLKHIIKEAESKAEEHSNASREEKDPAASARHREEVASSMRLAGDMRAQLEEMEDLAAMANVISAMDRLKKFIVCDAAELSPEEAGSPEAYDLETAQEDVSDAEDARDESDQSGAEESLSDLENKAPADLAGPSATELRERYDALRNQIESLRPGYEELTTREEQDRYYEKYGLTEKLDELNRLEHELSQSVDPDEYELPDVMETNKPLPDIRVRPVSEKPTVSDDEPQVVPLDESRMDLPVAGPGYGKTKEQKLGDLEKRGDFYGAEALGEFVSNDGKMDEFAMASFNPASTPKENEKVLHTVQFSSPVKGGGKLVLKVRVSLDSEMYPTVKRIDAVGGGLEGTVGEFTEGFDSDLIANDFLPNGWRTEVMDAALEMADNPSEAKKSGHVYTPASRRPVSQSAAGVVSIMFRPGIFGGMTRDN